MKSTAKKVVISVICTAGGLLHLCFPSLAIDSVTLALLVVGVLPWMVDIVESAKLPGGWEIKFRNLKDAANSIITSDTVGVDCKDSATTSTSTSTTTTSTTTTPPPPQQPSYMQIAPSDPNLALVGLRVEIEKRVRRIAQLNGLADNRSLIRTLNDLARMEVFDRQAVGGISEIVDAGNKAAHGARVEPSVADWAFEFGPKVLAELDRHLQDGPRVIRGTMTDGAMEG